MDEVLQKVAITLLTLLAAGSARAGDIGFSEVPVPVTDAEKRQVVASSRVAVDGEVREIGYRTLLRSGDRLGDGVFGQLFDIKGRPVHNDGGAPDVSNSIDFSSLLPVGERLFSISHLEGRPGAMYFSELHQDGESGVLTALSTQPIDFSSLGGLWVPCAGSVTPWGTHLGSEEYPPNGWEIETAGSMTDIDSEYLPMARYFGLPADGTDLDAFRAALNPYAYGFAVEVQVDGEGRATPAKHYAMGRVSLELAYVMPDRRTVYMTDDGSNVGFFMFVADRAGDLSAGRLFAAKWHQTSGDGAGAADITWIDLGHADAATIGKAIDSRPQFSDLFDASKPDEAGRCPAGFASVNIEPKCLRVKPGMEVIASRLETTRFAAYRGATTEFRKEEGITYDPDGKALFVAMSELSSGMEDRASKGKPKGEYDDGGPNHVRLGYNPCGAVYRLEVGRDEAIGSDFVVKNSKALVVGKPAKYDGDSPYKGNTCDVDGIANPDNLTFIAGYRTLIIGEDSGSGHQNDAVWSYELDSGKLTRILTTPYGSETTSPYIYRNVNGWGYLMTVVQHPYGESDKDKLVDPADARAYVGYIGPLPALK